MVGKVRLCRHWLGEVSLCGHWLGKVRSSLVR